MKFYFTFGQVHTHSVNGHTLDKDCVAVINAPDYGTARHYAFDWFGSKFHQQYAEKDWNDSMLEYYPRGLIELNPEIKNPDPD